MMTSIGQRLKYARDAVSKTLRTVHEVTGIGESSISEWENGGREPSFSQLAKLAKAYDRDVNFFLDTEPLPQDIVLWREKPADNSASETAVRLIRLAEQFQRLEQLCGNPASCSLVLASGTSETFSWGDAESLAHEFRISHSLGERPAASLMTVLEEVCRVKIFHDAFEPSGTAACIRSDRLGSAILLNSNNIRWRRNFDLAHELFHLLTWAIFRLGENLLATSETEEKLANKFASCLLMPSEPLKSAVTSQRNGNSSLDYDDLFEIARQFDVSVDALLWRMVDMKLIDRTKAKETRTSIRGQVGIWEKRRSETPSTRPVRFEALALEAIAKGKISTGKFAEFMGITRLAAMKRIEEDVYAVMEEGRCAQVELIDP